MKSHDQEFVGRLAWLFGDSCIYHKNYNPPYTDKSNTFPVRVAINIGYNLCELNFMHSPYIRESYWYAAFMIDFKSANNTLTDGDEFSRR